MTTGDARSIFVDTNVLVYASIVESPFRPAALSALEGPEKTGVELWTSRQVLREFLSVLSRPGLLSQPIPVAMLTAGVRHFQARFRIAEDDAMVTNRLVELLEQIPIAGKQIHDANIVATMLAYGIQRLLTHNTADFGRYSSHIIVLPLIPDN
jgi:predicted nucleic acid-binding protein